MKPSLRADVAALRKRAEALAGVAVNGRCPSCPPIAFVDVDEDHNVTKGTVPQPCAVCGGPWPPGVRLIGVVVPPRTRDPEPDDPESGVPLVSEAEEAGPAPGD